jgi:hypothetical protein
MVCNGNQSWAKTNHLWVYCLNILPTVLHLAYSQYLKSSLPIASDFGLAYLDTS